MAILYKYYIISGFNRVNDMEGSEYIESSTAEALEEIKAFGDFCENFKVDEDQGLYNNLKKALVFGNMYNIFKHSPDLFKGLVVSGLSEITDQVKGIKYVFKYSPVAGELVADIIKLDGKAFAADSAKHIVLYSSSDAAKSLDINRYVIMVSENVAELILNEFLKKEFWERSNE